MAKDAMNAHQKSKIKSMDKLDKLQKSRTSKILSKGSPAEHKTPGSKFYKGKKEKE